MADLLSMFNSLNNLEDKREGSIRAPFGYPGAKGESLPFILPHLPYRKKFGEVFGGSGAVLLARNEVELEMYNDRHAGVTAFYRCCRDRVKLAELIERLRLSIHSREEFEWSRDTWKDCTEDVERAARWYYSVITSFGSQGRNFGRCVKGRAQIGPKLYRNIQHFHEFHDRIKSVQIENLDWRQCLNDYDDEDMVWYLDPPYINSSSNIYLHQFSLRDHEELLERIFHLKGFVALSGYDNPLYNKYKWTEKYQWKVSVKTLALAFTETNHQKGREDREREMTTETLWIKE